MIFYCAGDLLAEDVDRRRPAVLVEPADGADGVDELGAGDVALREPPDDRPGHRREHPNNRALDERQGARF